MEYRITQLRKRTSQSNKIFFSILMSVIFAFLFCFHQSSFSATFTVSTTGDGKEIITPKNKKKVKSGSKVTFMVKAKARYKNAKLVGGTCPAGKWSGIKYTTGRITSNCKLIFTAGKIGERSLIITASGDGNETILPASQKEIIQTGTLAQFTVTAHSGYTLSTTVGGTCKKGTWLTPAIYTVRPLVKACTLIFSATLNQGGGGHIDAQFNQPYDLAVDSLGNIYVADYGNNKIRKITAAGVVSTFAGATNLFGSTDGTGTAARFNLPVQIAVDATGTVYVSDSGNNTIRKITSAGVVTTLAGSPGSSGGTDGTGAAARFAFPYGLGFDSAGNIMVVSSDSGTIRQITPAGDVTTIAGTSFAGGGSADGTGSAARFYGPVGLAVDSSDNIYVMDRLNQTIRKIDPSRVVTTFVGSVGTFGYADGTGNAAEFNYPTDVAVDSIGNLFVADTNNHAIRKVTTAGVVTTFAGTAGVAGSSDGTGTAASFNYPQGIAIDSSDNVYVADTQNHTIRKITPAGVVTTVSGTAGVSGSTNGN